jgi:DNA-binding MarR family transcriptional regulator
MRVLLALRRSAPAYALNPTALYQELMITSGAVSKQVDRLVALGLVERVADPVVLRGVLIQLKDPGRDIAEDMMREVCTSFEGLEGMTADAADDVLRALATVRAALDAAPLVSGAAP